MARIVGFPNPVNEVAARAVAVAATLESVFDRRPQQAHRVFASRVAEIQAGK